MSYQLSKREEELTRWVIGCALEMMMDNLVDDPDGDHNLEATYDGAIENWQEYADEELEDIQTGLAAFVMQGSGRFGRPLDEEHQAAFRAEQMKYIVGEQNEDQ